MGHDLLVDQNKQGSFFGQLTGFGLMTVCVVDIDTMLRLHA